MFEGARGPSIVKDFSATLRRIVGSGAIALGAIAAANGGAEAKVLRIVIDKVERFRIRPTQRSLWRNLGGARMAKLDPLDPANEIIADLKLAPRNANGKVEYISVFELAKPVDRAGSGRLNSFPRMISGVPPGLVRSMALSVGCDAGRA
jgi:hypothetical protein